MYLGMYYGNEVISVTAKGSAETEFVSATFKASITTHGKTGPKAKEQAVPIIEKLKEIILAHADKAGIDTTRLKTTFSVEIDTHRNSGEFVGYRAVYTINFTGTNVKAAPLVHDALTSIDSVQAPTPIYNLSEASSVHALAFANAVDRAGARFKDQCAALKLNDDDFKVASWSITDEEHRGKTLSFSEPESPKAVGLEPGKASIDIKVTFAYVRKNAVRIGTPDD
jgi:uncharacterized protein YggE